MLKEKPGLVNYQTSVSGVASQARPISVSISNLSKFYQKGKGTAKIVANQDISLVVEQGEIFGLLGPNGAGKTTLINQVLGLVKPDEGEITVCGIDVVRQSQSGKIKNITSFLPQKSIDFGSVEVERIMTYTGQLRGQSKAQARSQAHELIHELQLKEVENQYLSRLSGGMRRTVNLAIALMGKPKLLVLDEPTNELDPARRQLIWNFLNNTLRKSGSTCILVTHNITEAAPVLDRVAVMNGGRIIAMGKPGELKQNFSKQARLELTFNSEFFANGKKALLESLANTGLSEDVQFEKEQFKSFSIKLYLNAEKADEVMGLLIHTIGLDKLDDWNLMLPSLEDAYLKLVGAVSKND